MEHCWGSKKRSERSRYKPQVSAAAIVRAAAVTAGQTNYEVIFQAKSQRGGDLPLTVTSEHAQTPVGHRKG